MHEEILSKKQAALLPLIKSFSEDFGLVGGTAIALYLGHRRSIDFDLFTLERLDNEKIRKIIRNGYDIQSVLVDGTEELTLVADSVKITFLEYPFKIVFSQEFGQIIKMPDLLTLAAMKVFALGRRAKWKDYVDLFFIFKQESFFKVLGKTKEIFGREFNEKLFREQLSYFEDLDYTEAIDFLPGFFVSDEIIQKSLKEISLGK